VAKIAKVAEQEIEPKQAVAPTEKVYTMAQHNRHWGPLNETVTAKEAEQFVWKRETGSVQSYRHTQTGLHIHIDGSDGKFYDRNGEPITTKEALDFAIPNDQKHSHSKDVEPNVSMKGYDFGIGM
jgi:hypothetical protein